MSSWLDFLQIALALGLGWLGWALFMVARATGRTGSSAGDAARRTPARAVLRPIARRRL